RRINLRETILSDCYVPLLTFIFRAKNREYFIKSLSGLTDCLKTLTIFGFKN
ncbi:MAG: hypothetical protein ACI8QG_003034, partial [Flavobacteriales bacterium]